MSIYSSAKNWLARGAALVPLQPGSKAQIKGFGPYRKKITDQEAARFWFEQRRCNLGVVCAGDLVCMDFDTRAEYAHWKAKAGDVADTLTEISRRGYHVFFHVWDDVVAGTGGLFEVKALRAVVTVAPSVVMGVEYKVVNQLPIKRVSFLAIPGIPSLLSERQKDKPLSRENPQRDRGGDLLARIKAAWDIVDIANQLQAARGRPALRSRSGTWWGGLCPFHDETRPSYYVNADGRFYGCRSCGARGDVINLYAALQGVDTRKAIAMMAETLADFGGAVTS